jgi:hypothetical protein
MIRLLNVVGHAVELPNGEGQLTAGGGSGEGEESSGKGVKSLQSRGRICTKRSGWVAAGKGGHRVLNPMRTGLSGMCSFLGTF